MKGDTMEIKVNGKSEKLTTTSLMAFLEEKKLKLEGLVVLLNDEILKKEDFEGITLKENDALEVLNFVSGG